MGEDCLLLTAHGSRSFLTAAQYEGIDGAVVLDSLLARGRDIYRHYHPHLAQGTGQVAQGEPHHRGITARQVGGRLELGMLDGVSPRFVERVASGDVSGNFTVAVRAHGDGGSGNVRDCLPGGRVQQNQAGMNVMDAAA